MSKESNVSSLQTDEEPYFIKHFYVLDAVEKHYGGLLSPNEHVYITKIRNLSPQALELYVRLGR